MLRDVADAQDIDIQRALCARPGVSSGRQLCNAAWLIARHVRSLPLESMQQWSSRGQLQGQGRQLEEMMTTGADIVDQISTTTTTWDLRGDGILELRAALSTLKTMTIYEIGAEREAECGIYNELFATVDVDLDLIPRRVVEHLEGGGVTRGAVRSRMGQRQGAAATITRMTTTTVLTMEEGELSGGGNGNDNVQR
jgi:hypothetical protein